MVYQIMFLLYYPLKQGLKQISGGAITLVTTVFTLLSIKTRIETGRSPAKSVV